MVQNIKNPEAYRRLIMVWLAGFLSDHTNVDYKCGLYGWIEQKLSSKTILFLMYDGTGAKFYTPVTLGVYTLYIS